MITKRKPIFSLAIVNNMAFQNTDHCENRIVGVVPEKMSSIELGFKGGYQTGPLPVSDIESSL
jgi:hypothetical protein